MHVPEGTEIHRTAWIVIFAHQPFQQSWARLAFVAKLLVCKGGRHAGDH